MDGKGWFKTRCTPITGLSFRIEQLYRREMKKLLYEKDTFPFPYEHPKTKINKNLVTIFIQDYLEDNLYFKDSPEISSHLNVYVYINVYQ